MFEKPTRVVFLHAHPDDEALATGALIVALTEAGHSVAVVTATRGERGEVVPGVATGPDLVAHRERERAGSLAALGVVEHAWLGTPAARAGEVAPRRYLDSGMRWLSETVAGPAVDADPSSLSLAKTAEAAADLAAYLSWFSAEMLISYDSHGGYGHPDHVACHWVGLAAAELAGVDFVEIVSEPRLPQPDAVEIEADEHFERVRQALACYASQLRVDGAEVVHVGGQRQPISTRCWLRPASGFFDQLDRLWALGTVEAAGAEAEVSAPGFLATGRVHGRDGESVPVIIGTATGRGVVAAAVTVDPVRAIAAVSLLVDCSADEVRSIEAHLSESLGAGVQLIRRGAGG